MADGIGLCFVTDVSDIESFCWCWLNCWVYPKASSVGPLGHMLLCISSYSVFFFFVQTGFLFYFLATICIYFFFNLIMLYFFFILKSRRSNIFRGHSTSIIIFKLKIIEKAEVMSHHKNFHILENINEHWRK